MQRPELESLVGEPHVGAARETLGRCTAQVEWYGVLHGHQVHATTKVLPVNQNFGTLGFERRVHQGFLEEVPTHVWQDNTDIDVAIPERLSDILVARRRTAGVRQLRDR